MAQSLFLDTVDSLASLGRWELFSRVFWLRVLLSWIFIRLLFALPHGVRCLIHGVPSSRFIWLNANWSLIAGGSWNLLNSLGGLLLPDRLINHSRLTWTLMESRLYATFGGACCTLMSQDHLTTIAYIMSTLVLGYLCLLLEVWTILSRNDLLTASKILNVSAWRAWLLPLLLDTRFLILFTDGVLLRQMHVAVTGLVEGALRLHRIRAISLHRR